MTRLTWVLCRTFLLLQILVCLISFGMPSLPGWKMFAKREVVSLRVVDRDGSDVDVRKWVPYPNYNFKDNDVRRVGAFLCRKNAIALPVKLVSIDGTTVANMNEGQCEWHE